MSNAIELHQPQATALSLVSHNELRFTPEQERMIRENYSTGATESEFEVLMAVAKARRLNPLLRQVHFVKRRDFKLGRDVWSVQVSIDGLRAIAERTGSYDGQDEPEFEHDRDGRVTVARVRVYKKGISRPFVGVARWSEYVQTTREGAPTKFWKDMPYTMLGKCAEALAIRKAFPEDSGSLYVPEEMMQADSERHLPRISPHVDADEDPNASAPNDDQFDRFMSTLTALETECECCQDYDAVLKIRAELGSKATASPLLAEMQKAREERTVSPEQRKTLGALWQRIDRKITKLEATIRPPSAEDSFRDPAEEFE